MRLLIDTHIAIWALADTSRLSPRFRNMLADKSNTIFISPVNIWEISIKFALRRQGSPPFSGREAADRLQEAGCRMLDVTRQHAIAVDNLPAIHGDPFDRLLVAQAISEPMHFLSVDAHMAQYSDLVIAN